MDGRMACEGRHGQEQSPFFDQDSLLSPPFRVFGEPRHLVAAATPRGCRTEEDPGARAERRRVVERSGGHHELATATRMVGQRRAAQPAEGGCEALRGRQVEADCVLAARRPAEAGGRRVQVRRVASARRLPAARAVAVGKTEKRRPDFVCDGAAKAAASKELVVHGPTYYVMLRRKGCDERPGATGTVAVEPVAQEAAHLRRRGGNLAGRCPGRGRHGP